jgi:hypothetical protein
VRLAEKNWTCTRQTAKALPLLLDCQRHSNRYCTVKLTVVMVTGFGWAGVVP